MKIPEMWIPTERIFSHFGPFFVLLPLPRNPKNQNFEKMKDTWIYHHFTQVYHK